MSKNKKSPILDAIYETACDLHSCGAFTDEQMKKYEELAPKFVPINLDYDVFECINKKYGSNREKVHVLVNDLLRKEFNITPPVL
ncbi:MAG: hypothetical protein NTZ45_08390 [Methylococcales bacterium]|jgi:hypothetical protein|nr:hypothetical protein [Methylococcales bacterium]